MSSTRVTRINEKPVFSGEAKSEVEIKLHRDGNFCTNSWGEQFQHLGKLEKGGPFRTRAIA